MPVLSPSHALDLNDHYPKLKFLFKVGFYGFMPDVRGFYFYVHRVDKPKVKLMHQDVNYYNYRTRVLTNVVYEPITMEFLDEVGDTVNTFFVEYLKARSGSGSGGFGIDQGFGPASSSKPYTVAPGIASGTRIIVEQIFANGENTNQFHFINPRIESFEFNELTMEESGGSMMTIQFSYDALESRTIGAYENPTWGNTDLLRADSMLGLNGGASSLGETVTNAVGQAMNGIGRAARSISPYQPGLISGGLTSDGILGASNPRNRQIPADLSHLAQHGIQQVSKPAVGSAMDTLSSSIQDTLHSIVSGDNLQFNGAALGTFNDRRFSGEVLDVQVSPSSINQTFPG